MNTGKGRVSKNQGRRPLVIAHRGFAERAPENTEASFRLALEAGANMIETDVRLSSDGHLLLAHDEDYARLGSTPIAVGRLTRKEISQLILKNKTGYAAPPLFLDEALECFPDTAFTVELKDLGLPIVDAWVSLLKRSGAEERCLTSSFSDQILGFFHRRFPKGMIALGRWGVLRLVLLSLFGFSRPPRSYEGVIQMPEYFHNFRLLTPQRIRIWQALGWDIHVWTIDEQQDMQRLIDWEVDGITTNKTALLVENLL